ncbi:radical SAM protein [Christensenellaceae bacterium OttesenSCG-928-M15]|nr:radical SAM protein [Christensenellaceae bacterium OttesenSCG-928-M15]
MVDRLFDGNETFLIWGAGRWGRLLYEFYPDLPVKAFIDNDIDKQNSEVNGKKILSFEEAVATYPDSLIVIAIQRVNRPRALLSSRGLVERKDFFPIYDFIPLYAWHTKKQLRTTIMQLAPNNTCTQKCEGCITYVPYAQTKVIRPLEELKRDVDLAFANINKTMMVCSSSGEPFLHPQIVDFWEYISENYAVKYHQLLVVTNSTIQPSDDAFRRLSKLNKVIFSLSNYSDMLPKQGENLRAMIDKLETYGIKYFLNTSSDKEDWNDCGDPRIKQEIASEALQKRYKDCTKTPCGVYDGKFFFCMQEAWANLSTGTPIYEDDYYDFESDTDLSKLRSIVLRQPEKGYLEFCSHCVGRIN